MLLREMAATKEALVAFLQTVHEAEWEADAGIVHYRGQPLNRAGSGAKVELVLDISLSDLQSGVPLQFTLESGAIGNTTIRFFTNPGDSPLSVFKIILSGMMNTFEVPAETFLSP